MSEIKKLENLSLSGEEAIQNVETVAGEERAAGETVKLAATPTPTKKKPTPTPTPTPTPPKGSGGSGVGEICDCNNACSMVFISGLLDMDKE